MPGAKGTIGFITPVSKPVCSYCNRIRLTSDGQLRSCLLSDEGIDLKGPLRNGASEREIRRLILETVASKPEKHHLLEDVCPEQKMSQIGG